MKAGALRAQLAAEIEKLRDIEWNVHGSFPTQAASGIELMHCVDEAEEILTERIESLEREVNGMGSVQFFVIAVILWLAVCR